MGQWKVPLWVMAVLCVCTLFNVFVFVSVVGFMWSPSAVDITLSDEAVLGLHLQLFEAFIAVVGISLAIFGFVGFSSVRNAAINAALEATREVHGTSRNERPLDVDIDPSDFDSKVTREPEGEGV